MDGSAVGLRAGDYIFRAYSTPFECIERPEKSLSSICSRDMFPDSTNGTKGGMLTPKFCRWNFWAWMMGLASTAQILAVQTLSMYGASHPGYIEQRWHIFICYFVYTWVSCLIVLYLNGLLPKFAALDGILVIVGVLVTIIVCAAYRGHATNDFVWREWQNNTGYKSNGFVFLLGMLNGAFAVGTPDVVTHLAEEIRR